MAQKPIGMTEPWYMRSEGAPYSKSVQGEKAGPLADSFMNRNHGRRRRQKPNAAFYSSFFLQRTGAFVFFL